MCRHFSCCSNAFASKINRARIGYISLQQRYPDCNMHDFLPKKTANQQTCMIPTQGCLEKILGMFKM